MAFKVNPTDSRPPLEFGDGDKLEVLPSGVLKIRRADKTTLYINPSMWENVEQTPTAAEAAGPQVHEWPKDSAPEDGPF